MTENQANKNQSKVVSDRIVSILAQKGISKKALASHLEVSENGLKKMMDNGSYKIDTLWKIAVYLKVDLIELLFDSKKTEPKQPDSIQDSIVDLVSVLKQQAEAILKNSNSIENQTIVMKENAKTIEAQRSQIAELSNKGIRKDINVLQQSVNILLKDKIEQQEKEKKDGKKKAG